MYMVIPMISIKFLICINDFIYNPYTIYLIFIAFFFFIQYNNIVVAGGDVHFLLKSTVRKSFMTFHFHIVVYDGNICYFYLLFQEITTFLIKTQNRKNGKSDKNGEKKIYASFLLYQRETVP